MQTPEEVAHEALGNIAGPMRHIWGSGPMYHELLDSLDVLVAQEAEVLTDLIRARDAEVAETATAENARLREGIAALHGAVQEFEPCPDGPWGCGELACTESVHTGERYHDDQPTGRVCLTCRYEDGEPHDWPCETAALLNPPTEGETR